MGLEFLYNRRSVRQFQEKPVSMEHIHEIIKAATYAPSGKNAQNWHFVVVTARSKIMAIAQLVEEKNSKLATYLQDQEKIAAFRGSVGYHTAFKGAPVLILVYAGYYETIADMLLEAGRLPQEEARMYSRPNPGIQNIAAAMENLLLAADSLGYGTCWMTGPTYAAEEISEYVGFTKQGYYLAAITPLGIPATSGAQLAAPPRKSVEEVLTVIS